MNYQVNLLSELHDKVVRGEAALIGSALQDAAHEIDRSFSMLEILGVSPARAGTVANGIDVLHTRMARESRDLRAEIERLRAALQAVYKLSGGHATECQCGQCEIFEFLEPIVGNTSAVEPSANQL